MHTYKPPPQKQKTNPEKKAKCVFDGEMDKQIVVYSHNGNYSAIKQKWTDNGNNMTESQRQDIVLKKWHNTLCFMPFT